MTNYSKHKPSAQLKSVTAENNEEDEEMQTQTNEIPAQPKSSDTIQNINQMINEEYSKEDQFYQQTKANVQEIEEKVKELEEKHSIKLKNALLELEEAKNECQNNAQESNDMKERLKDYGDSSKNTITETHNNLKKLEELIEKQREKEYLIKEYSKQIKELQAIPDNKDKQLESLQEDMSSHNLTFVANNEAVAAQFKGIMEKNNELRKQIETVSRNKQYVDEPDDKKLMKLKNLIETATEFIKSTEKELESPNNEATISAITVLVNKLFQDCS